YRAERHERVSLSFGGLHLDKPISAQTERRGESTGEGCLVRIATISSSSLFPAVLLPQYGSVLAPDRSACPSPSTAPTCRTRCGPGPCHRVATGPWPGRSLRRQSWDRRPGAGQWL